MKTLFITIMLFICALLRGQNIDTNIYWHYIDPNGNTAKINLGTWRVPYEPEVVQLIFDYADECYNDSTFIATKYVWFSPCEPNVICLNWQYEKIRHGWYIMTGTYDDQPAHTKFVEKRGIYSHRQPTFEGFIEYLKKKYK